MVHLGKMHVEAALFFETVEEIYARVFRVIRPQASIPVISVQFRKYANANSKIRLSEGRLSIKISDLLEAAPAPVQEALAYILLSKLFRRTPPSTVMVLYHRYLNRGEVLRNLQLVKQQRGHKKAIPPLGRYFDLKEIFQRLNDRYFSGRLEEPLLGWSVRHSRTILGHYDSAHHAIVLTRLLDSSDASRLVVDYVMFHEMLHIEYPTEQRATRRCVHTSRFKQAEKTFECYIEARAELRKFIDSRLV